MKRPHPITFAIALATFLVAAYLLWYRGGYLAWIGVGLGALQLIKIFTLSKKSDIYLVPMLSVLWGASWGLVFYLIIAGWESGEVTALTISVGSEEHVARVWLLDWNGTPAATYVTSSTVVDALASGTAVDVATAGVSSSWLPQVTDYAELSPTELNEINTLYFEKYGDLNNWTTVFYAWLGNVKDRQTVLITFEPV